jgi:hypothetical protein
MLENIFLIFGGLTCEKFSAVQHEPGECSKIVVKALCYTPEGRGFDTR